MKRALITSAAYVTSELAAEFGVVPPSFLPLGNRRLYEHQLQYLAKESDAVFISLPQSFVVPSPDIEVLRRGNVSVLCIDDGLSLRESVLQAMNLMGFEPGDELIILHGDTLIEGGLPAESFAVADKPRAYEWSAVDINSDGVISGILPTSAVDERRNGSEAVLCGYFRIENWQSFVVDLAMASRFEEGLDRYARKRNVLATNPSNWFDFGHAQSYYGSRSQLTTQRSFNSLRVDGRTVTKSSEKPNRIDAESSWYREIPEDLRVFAPQYLGRTESSYSIEYLNLPSLADLFVFGDLQRSTWRRIFDACAEFLVIARPHSTLLDGFSAVDLYRGKTLRRLEEFGAALGISLDAPWRVNGKLLPPLRDFVDDLMGMIKPLDTSRLSIVHGDFCFGNILYDFKSDAVKVIDPRGEDSAGRLTIYGDQRYEMAKLHHSAIGLYDVIMSGRLTATVLGPYELDYRRDSTDSQLAAGVEFHSLIESISPGESGAISAISALLFLSMLPLHSDDQARQAALLANAYSLRWDV